MRVQNLSQRTNREVPFTELLWKSQTLLTLVYTSIHFPSLSAYHPPSLIISPKPQDITRATHLINWLFTDLRCGQAPLCPLTLWQAYQMFLSLCPFLTESSCQARTVSYWPSQAYKRLFSFFLKKEWMNRWINKSKREGKKGFSQHETRVWQRDNRKEGVRKNDIRGRLVAAIAFALFEGNRWDIKYSEAECVISFENFIS